LAMVYYVSIEGKNALNNKNKKRNTLMNIQGWQEIVANNRPTLKGILGGRKEATIYTGVNAVNKLRRLDELAPICLDLIIALEKDNNWKFTDKEGNEISLEDAIRAFIAEEKAGYKPKTELGGCHYYQFEVGYVMNPNGTIRYVLFSFSGRWSPSLLLKSVLPAD
jgi:hypothetical protein